jgi:hypothetical protein
MLDINILLIDLGITIKYNVDAPRSEGKSNKSMQGHYNQREITHAKDAAFEEPKRCLATEMIRLDANKPPT